MLTFILKKLITAYRYFISPLLGQHCRHYPSCSQYALHQLEQAPIWRAIPLIIYRLFTCWPLGEWIHQQLRKIF